MRRSIPYLRKGHVGTQEAVDSLGAHRCALQRLRCTPTPVLLENTCTGFFCERPRLCMSPVFPSGPNAFRGYEALSRCVHNYGYSDLRSCSAVSTRRPGPRWTGWFPRAWPLPWGRVEITVQRWGTRTPGSSLLLDFFCGQSHRNFVLRKWRMNEFPTQM